MRVLSLCRKLASVGLGAAVLLTAGNALAQAPATAQPGRQFTAHFQTFPSTGTGCPVAMTATQRGLSQQIETGTAVPARSAQGLTVSLAGTRALRITKAEIVAHALSGRNRALLTSSAPVSDVTRTFELVAKDDDGFSADLWMNGVTSIQQIEVKSLTYSDGSVWRESEERRCTAAPNPMVLISAMR